MIEDDIHRAVFAVPGNVIGRNIDESIACGANSRKGQRVDTDSSISLDRWNNSPERAGSMTDTEFQSFGIDNLGSSVSTLISPKLNRRHLRPA